MISGFSSFVMETAGIPKLVRDAKYWIFVHHQRWQRPDNNHDTWTIWFVICNICDDWKALNYTGLSKATGWIKKKSLEEWSGRWSVTLNWDFRTSKAAFHFSLAHIHLWIVSGCSYLSHCKATAL